MNPSGSTPVAPVLTDPILAEIGTAVALGRSGHGADARAALEALWSRIGPEADPFHRCTLAHYLADLQPDPETELDWDERALAAVDELTTERLAQAHPGFSVPGFLPSLHLNLADVHRRLSHPDQARAHLALAMEFSTVLTDDAYGKLVRAGLEQVSEALAAGSTARLPGAP